MGVDRSSILEVVGLVGLVVCAVLAWGWLAAGVVMFGVAMVVGYLIGDR